MSLENEEKFEKLQALIDELKIQKGALMPIMQGAQEIFGYLPEEVQTYIADALDIPLSDVYGVATFYAQFSLEPRGRYNVGLCLGTACYVKGAQQILESVEKVLGVKTSKTTSDAKFTLTATRCLGACGLAPVMMINDRVYGRLTPDRVPEIFADYENL